MNNDTFILIYFLISLFLLILVGIFLYRFRNKEEIEFKKYYPLLLEKIKRREFEKAILVLDKLMWNSNMEIHFFYNILNELKTFELKEYDSNIEMIKNKINEVIDKKG